MITKLGYIIYILKTKITQKDVILVIYFRYTKKDDIINVNP